MQPEAGPNKIYKARQKRKGALEESETIHFGDMLVVQQ
jgi:hypothetical protein